MTSKIETTMPSLSKSCHQRSYLFVGTFFEFSVLTLLCLWIRPIGINNAAIEKLIGHIDFYSATYRLWKIEGLEPDCEDYGQVTYDMK